MNYLLWVSGLIKIDDFVDESVRLGISRCLPFLPRGLNKGSKIYLASLQIHHFRNIDGKVKHETNPVIFGEFEVDHVDFIVDKFNQLLQDKFTRRGLIFQQLTKIQTRKEPKRKDGKRLTANTIYAVNYPPDNYEEKVKKREGNFTVYNPYIPCGDIKFFRGVKIFDISKYLRLKKGS
jgi:hypothetical protein